MEKARTILVAEDACVIVLRVPEFDIAEIEDEDDLNSLYKAEPLLVFDCADDESAKRLLVDIAQYMRSYIALPDREFRECLVRRFGN